MTRGSMAEAVPYIEQSFAVALAAGRKDLQTHRVAGTGPGAHRPARARQGRTPDPQGASSWPTTAAARAHGVRRKLTLGLLYRMRNELRRGRGGVRAGPRAVRGDRSRHAALATRCPAWLTSPSRRAISSGRRSSCASRSGCSPRSASTASSRSHRPSSAACSPSRARSTRPSASWARPRSTSRRRSRSCGCSSCSRSRPSVRRRSGDDEAEELFVEALAITDEVDFTALEAEALRRIVRFLEDSGQNGKAAPYEERLAVLVPAESTAEIA